MAHSSSCSRIVINGNAQKIRSTPQKGCVRKATIFAMGVENNSPLEKVSMGYKFQCIALQHIHTNPYFSLIKIKEERNIYNQITKRNGKNNTTVNHQGNHMKQ